MSEDPTTINMHAPGLAPTEEEAAARPARPVPPPSPTLTSHESLVAALASLPPGGALVLPLAGLPQGTELVLTIIIGGAVRPDPPPPPPPDEQFRRYLGGKRNGSGGAS
jgi:hypothetical protein